MRTVQPQGPYRLLGWSFGGNVAAEIAHQLESAGDNVDILILLDTSLATQGEPPAELDEGQLLLYAAKNLGIDIEGVPIDQAKQHFLGAMLGQGLIPLGTDLPILERIVAAMQRSISMMHRQEISLIEAPILYVRASDNTLQCLEASLSAVTSGSVIIEQVSETHGKMCSDESSPKLADHINNFMYVK
jgi:thioesterase domain-containing protein